ncbi:hypothetical protein PC121_g6405 [Phytophthora cactorum]|nr:hypothetical protein PC120_g4616 [Phytophthora cactorum]KAG3081671.1 hypothetical protein PC121_g6405 [Phytophthora cactorum]KAG4060740.1 hypothetical protein PC123_g4352 [Phytophthora cactorum]
MVRNAKKSRVTVGGELKNRALGEECARRQLGSAGQQRLEGPATSEAASGSQEGRKDRLEHSTARQNHSQRFRRHRTSAFRPVISLAARFPSFSRAISERTPSVEIFSSRLTA